MTQFSTEQAARHLLLQARGRITPARLGVLSILLDADAALSHQEIEHTTLQQGCAFDRVTLYRALDWLVKQRVAHKIKSVKMQDKRLMHRLSCQLSWFGLSYPPVCLAIHTQ